MMRLRSNLLCRLTWLAIALFVLLVPTLAPMPGGGQEIPPPRPEGTIYFYDAHGIFEPDQLTTLQRDAQLVQSSGIPTLVYARAVPAMDASEDTSQTFADQLRRQWHVESAPNAEDGLVLLFSWVPQDPQASTAVFSYGEHTFEGSGLSPEAIQRTIDTSVRSLVEQAHPFETLVYLMRETRYTGIYAPPPPIPVEGLAKTVHDILVWVAPALVGIVTVALSILTRAFWRIKPTRRHAWSVAGVVLAGAVFLFFLSVYARSTIGAGSSLAIVIILALAAWMWSRQEFERHGSRPVRRRAVPSTHTLMRKRRQAKTMLAREAGGTR